MIPAMSTNLRLLQGKLSILQICPGTAVTSIVLQLPECVTKRTASLPKVRNTPTHPVIALHPAMKTGKLKFEDRPSKQHAGTWNIATQRDVPASD